MSERRPLKLDLNQQKNFIWHYWRFTFNLHNVVGITKAPPFLRPYQPRPKSHVISSQCFTVLHVYAMFLRNKSKHCITNYNQRGSCDRYFSQFQLFKILFECVILDSLNIRYWRGARRVVYDGSEIWAVKVNPSTPPVASDQFLVIYFCTLYTVRI